MRLSRRGLQIALGGLWLLDGALQLQPVMFTTTFARGIIAPAGAGQPTPVHWLVTTAAAVIGARPVLFDALFASVQLLIGLGLWWRRSAEGALVASILWATGVWIFGEGFGGIFGSGATLANGAPGAAILYALLAVVALDLDWRGKRLTLSSGSVSIAWVATWAGLGALALGLGARAGGTLAASLRASAPGLPSLLRSSSTALASGLHPAGALPGVLLGALCLLIGLAGLAGERWRLVAAVAGGLLALFVWVFAEAFGGIGTGLATDPNSGPLLVLFAFVLASGRDGAGRASLPAMSHASPVMAMNPRASDAA